MNQTSFLAFVFCKQVGYLLQLETGQKYTIGSGAKDDCRFDQLAGSQITILTEEGTVSLRYSFFKKQILEINAFNTVQEYPELVIYLRDYQDSEEIKIELPERVAVSIGRKEGADLQIMNPFVSARHVLIEKRDGRLLVQDQDSSNGTFINTKRIVSQVLNEGESFHILHMTFLFDGTCLLVKNLYDPFNNYIHLEQGQLEDTVAHIELKRPQNVDLKLRRMMQNGIQIERFHEDYIVEYPYTEKEEELPLYLFEGDYIDDLISPYPFNYNGHQALLYHVSVEKQLHELWNHITLEELISILQAFFKTLCRLDAKRDVDIRHILVDFSAVFVNVMTLDVKLIYIPFSEIVSFRFDDYLNAVRYALKDSLDSFIVNTDQEKEVIARIVQVLTNGILPFDKVEAELGKIHDSLYLYGDIYADEEPLWERISSRTMRI